MQIKLVGQRYQLIRYHSFDSETRRIKTRVIGSIAVGSVEIPLDLLEKLKPEEETQLTERLTADEVAARPKRDRQFLMTLPDALLGATRALEAGQKPTDPKEIRTAITMLHTALRRSIGAGRVRRKRMSAMEEA